MSMSLTGAAWRSVVVVLCAMLLVAPAHAAEKTPAKPPPSALVPAILIVDLPQVLHESTAGKGVQATLTKTSQAYAHEVAHQEDELQKMRSDLERQRTVLSPKAFDAKAKQFQQHYQALDRSVQEKRQALAQAYNTAMLKVEKTALDIIAELAKERGANLVLAKQATILQAEGADITAEVVARLDKTLTSVPVHIGKPAEAPTPGRHHRGPK
jgi:outer membrane protein